MILNIREVLAREGMPDSDLGGIYAITNSVTSKYYVGSAVSLAKRFYNHAWHLERGTHRNPKLRASWHKHGEAAFTFKVLEIVADHSALIEREQFWIDKMKAAKKGYNICPTAGSAYGRKYSAEARRNVAVAASKAMSDPEVKVRHRAAVAQAMAKPGVREKTQTAARARWANSEYRQKQKATRSSPEYVAKASDHGRRVMAQQLADPAVRAEYVKGQATKAHVQAKTRTPEQREVTKTRLRLAANTRVPDHANAYSYRIISPIGEEAVIHDLKGFCRQFAVPYSIINSAVLLGRPTATGYRFERLEVA